MSIVLRIFVVQRLRLIQDFHDKKDKSDKYKRKNNKHKTIQRECESDKGSSLVSIIVCLFCSWNEDRKT